MSGTPVIDLKAEGPKAHAARLAADHSASEATEILRTAVEEFGDSLALVSSFGAESAVLLHIASRVAPDLPVIFLETGKHFAQTLNYRRKLAAKLGLTNVQDIRPAADEVAAEDPDGDLWRRDTDACCTLRKVRPLDTALSGYGAWVTGRKQFHGGARVSLPAFEHTGSHYKVNPLVRWNPDDISAYFEANDLPPHPLVAQGFPSIGCWPCTHPVGEGEDARSGRWRGQAKTECGIHGRA
ncbi:phosphoadenylyl-sulfate reductase [Parvularcula oceani]|uniref:phosphoadenylyl-sulfate reductase n=1 Tax=Parvularcula oceani TaxID=1247963 RepID=UPI000A9F35AB|nr:phosphoadenylyl-sulfate reductase [Parvularcula oceani]